MARTSSTILIDASADATWRLIADFGAACRYLPGVSNCTVEGEGVGALRTLTSTDGSTIVERLESLDAVARRLSYVLLTDTPFRNCLTTVAVHGLGPCQCESEWSVTFEADGLPVSEAVELIRGAIEATGVALKQFVEAGSK